jgi:hypothetical protein
VILIGKRDSTRLRSWRESVILYLYQPLSHQCLPFPRFLLITPYGLFQFRTASEIMNAFQYFIGLTWRRKTYTDTGQHNTIQTKTRTTMPRVGFEATIPAFERLKTHALDPTKVRSVYCVLRTRIKYVWCSGTHSKSGMGCFLKSNLTHWHTSMAAADQTTRSLGFS